MLIFALLAVFIAGLMVGRTPEYLGKKIQAPEMKLVVLYILVGAARGPRPSPRASVVMLATALSQLNNPGPHGLTEIIYAFTSAATTTVRPSAGSTGNTDWFNTTLGVCRCWSAGSC